MEITLNTMMAAVAACLLMLAVVLALTIALYIELVVGGRHTTAAPRVIASRLTNQIMTKRPIHPKHTKQMPNAQAVLLGGRNSHLPVNRGDVDYSSYDRTTAMGGVHGGGNNRLSSW